MSVLLTRSLAMMVCLTVCLSGSSFSQESAVPVDYRLRPGDEVSLDVNGEKDLTKIFTVNEEGDLNLPYLGKQTVVGLTAQEATTTLTEMLSKDYLVDPKVILSVVKIAQEKNRESSGARQVPELVQKMERDASSTEDLSEVIQIGDKLKVHVYREPDFSGVFTVDENGNVTFLLLGEVYVQGLTLGQFQRLLKERLEEQYLVDPQIQVRYESATQKAAVTLIGQVMLPGSYEIKKNMTLIRLVVDAGGFTTLAASSQIRMMRQNKQSWTVQIIDGKNILNGIAPDISVQAGDVIEVPDLQAEKEKASKKHLVTLMGQISKPGNYEYSHGLTLLRLVADAGGFPAAAAPNRIRLVRQRHQGRKILMIDVTRIMAGISEDVRLHKGDVIVVPEAYF